MGRDVEAAPLLGSHGSSASFFGLQVQWSTLKFTNVVVMGLAFMLVFTAYNTTQNFATKLLNQEGFGNLGFESLAVLYVAVAICVPFAPVLVPWAGERLSMWIGAFCYIVYIASLIKILPPLVYAAAVVIGFGAAVLWVAQGGFLTKCSTEQTRGRNSGIFWSLFQLSGILGNLGAYVILGLDQPPEVLFIILSAVGLVGVFVLFLLRPLNAEEVDGEIKPAVKSVKQLLIQCFRTLTQKKMILMLLFMFFSGFELGFFSGEFPLLMDSKLIGLVMTIFGIGEVVGGILFGKLSDYIGRKPVAVFGLVVYFGALAISWVMHEDPHASYFTYLACTGAACLGIADSIFNTMIYASLGTMFPGDESIPAFTIFQFFQSSGSACGFIVIPFLPVHGSHGSMTLLFILAGNGLLGVFLFLFVRLKKTEKEKTVN